MKREVSWGAAAAVTLAAVIGISQYGNKPEGDTSTPPKLTTKGTSTALTAKSLFDRGPCLEIEERLQAFLLNGRRDSLAAPASCYGLPTSPENEKELGEKIRIEAKNLHFVIATLPDPVHSHLSLSFDRFTEAIQQGASDEQYIYDSSWLPWNIEETPYALIQDQDKADDRKKRREEQPGILLFRKESDRSLADPFQPFREGLVIFVVGEDPTQGIHRTQFKNAAAWIAALQPLTNAKATRYKLPDGGIIGPSFSGSLPSLAQLLSEIRQKPQGQTKRFASSDSLRIYSGNVSGQRGVDWFVAAESMQQNIHFATFQQSDDVLIDEYCRYLRQSNFNLRRLAIVSEDETAYGSEASAEKEPRKSDGGQPKKPFPGCYEVQERSPQHYELSPRFFYPRDISALRTAYQKQSIFDFQASQSSAQTGRRTLSTNIADPEGQQHDTIRNYNSDQTAQSQEAVLQQIVSQLRTHQSEYILLRSSNPLDQLFLAHYFRLAYPQGRIVILGADLLLRRESGAARLSGIMTLTTYPLLPWEAHWTRDPYDPNYHSHRIFPQDGAEGTYIATRFLLHPATLRQGGIFLPTDAGLTIPDYTTPFWIRDQSPEKNTVEGPAAWLSVLGRNDFWPLAAMNKWSLPDAPSQQRRSFRQCYDSFYWYAHQATASLGSIFTFWHAKTAFELGNNLSWDPMPLSLRVALCILFAWAMFHFVCCSFPSITSKPSHRTYFVCSAHSFLSHRALLVLGSLALSSTATALASGYGAMSPVGLPLRHPRLCLGLLPSLWLISGLSLVVNLWRQADAEPITKKGEIEFAAPELAPQRETTMKHLQNGLPTFQKILAWSRRLRVYLASRWRFLWPPLTYVAGTVGFYFWLYFSTERVLISVNRIPVYWRDMNLTSGVSPVIPIVALSVGAYMWFWYSLQGLAFFGPDVPVLPSGASLEFPGEGKAMSNRLRMFSREHAAAPVEARCWPFSKGTLGVGIGLLVSLIVLAKLLGTDGEEPIRSLGARSYAQFICLLEAASVSLMLANAWQLLHIWIRLRQLLTHLDRVPLRRSMAAFPGVSWSSVWKVSGNVLDMRYKLLVSQLESLTHLQNSLALTKMKDCAFWEGPRSYSALEGAFSKIKDARANFSKWYAEVCDQTDKCNQDKLKKLQESLAELAGQLLAWMLLPAWRMENEELLSSGASKSGDSKDEKNEEKQLAVPLLAPHIRHAEQLVCYVYLGFIQNTLGRMRTLVICMLWLYVAATVSMASYPFDPRPVVNGALVVLFFGLGTIIVFVYAQMHRDPILSIVTNTNPGELDSDFWIRLVSFGAGPLLGLAATIFPGLTDFLFSWAAPGISPVK